MPFKVSFLYIQGITGLCLLSVLDPGESFKNNEDTKSDANRKVETAIVKYGRKYSSLPGLEESGKKNHFILTQILEKAFFWDYISDTIPPMNTGKTPVPQNKQEILSIDLNQPVILSQQPINVKIDNKIQQLIQNRKDEDFTRKATILEITVSYKTAPKNSYTAYVNTHKKDSKKIAGYMHFFGAGTILKRIPGEGSKKFLFDISAEYNIKTLKDNLKLLIVNDSGNPANEITVKKIRIETRDY
jgi:hypothetical protein